MFADSTSEKPTVAQNAAVAAIMILFILFSFLCPFRNTVRSERKSRSHRQGRRVPSNAGQEEALFPFPRTHALYCLRHFSFSRFCFARLYEQSLDYPVPRCTLYHNRVSFWEKILKIFFRSKLPASPEKGQKLSSPLISLGVTHFQHSETALEKSFAPTFTMTPAKPLRDLASISTRILEAPQDHLL